MQPIFISTSEVQQVWDKLQAIAHYGIVGPTKRRQYIVRSVPTTLAELRKTTAGGHSQYANDWGMMITKKFELNLRSFYSHESVSASLRRAMGWSCVVVSARKTGKNLWQYILGAAEEPKSHQIAFGKEIAVLKELKPKADEALAQVRFEAPQDKVRPTRVLPEDPMKERVEQLAKEVEDRYADVSSRHHQQETGRIDELCSRMEARFTVRCSRSRRKKINNGKQQ